MSAVLTSPLLRRCGGSAQPSMRPICLPYVRAGASLRDSRRLSGKFGVEVWAVRPPGRKDRWCESPVRRIEPMVAAAGAMGPLLDRPLPPFGRGMGALLAYELCRTRRDGPVPAVGLGASRSRPVAVAAGSTAIASR
ncbi:hypothetical protein [Nonomuraea sp. NPDC050786]|uniref:thioesterase II family protein n=1 Tax=Nonomuraea sp. NPDC050786 TaxID=3154840 RepID=UPI0033F2F6AB